MNYSQNRNLTRGPGRGSAKHDRFVTKQRYSRTQQDERQGSTEIRLLEDELLQLMANDGGGKISGSFLVSHICNAILLRRVPRGAVYR